MKKGNVDTKSKIQQTALELFCKRGFSAVSIRDIGKLVGVKESTIYYHFENKQEIFNSLLTVVKNITQQMKTAFDAEFKKIITLNREEFIKVGIGILEGYLLDNHVNKFIRMLTIEQHVNQDAAALYQEILFNTPLNQNREVFQLMMMRGYFKKDNAERLALEYYAPIYLIFQRYFSCGELKFELLERAKMEVKEHTKAFYERYIIND